MSTIERIRQAIRDRNYYLSMHAEEELAEDRFDRADMEHALLHGYIEKRLTHDPRGARYRIEGPAQDGRTMRVVCRFQETGSLIIITAYERS